MANFFDSIRDMLSSASKNAGAGSSGGAKTPSGGPQGSGSGQVWNPPEKIYQPYSLQNGMAGLLYPEDRQPSPANIQYAQEQTTEWLSKQDPWNASAARIGKDRDKAAEEFYMQAIWDAEQDKEGTAARESTYVSPEQRAAREKRESVLNPGTNDTISALFGAAPASQSYNELTTEQYNKLNDRQRAAVDYNTMLVDAVNADKANQGEYKTNVSDQQREAYNVAVEDMFGSNRGSDLYAPETVALLRQLKLDDKVADLDDFLDLRATITDDDLKALDGEARPLQSYQDTLFPIRQITETLEDAAFSDPADARMLFTDRLAQRSENLTRQLAKGNQLLQDVATSARAANDWRQGFGAKPGRPQVAEGFGDTETDALFREVYEAIADSGRTTPDGGKVDRAFIEDMMNQAGGTEGLDSFLNYVDTKTRQAARYGLPTGEVEGVKYRSPDEIRALLGLGK